MTQFHVSIDTHHQALNIYNLVLDVEKYPYFLPWCLATRIISNEENKILADMIISFKGMNSQFRSQIITKTPSINDEKLWQIDVTQIQGPFVFMKNSWNIKQISTHKTKIDFYINFEFKSSLMEKLASLFLEDAVAKITSAFIHRADIIYPKQYRK